MTKITHTVHAATGEFCTSRNGDITWVVGAFASAELAAAACFADALVSSAEGDVVTLPDGSRYRKDSETLTRISLPEGDNWDIWYSVTAHEVADLDVEPAPSCVLPDGVTWRTDTEGRLLAAASTPEAVFWIAAHLPGLWVPDEDGTLFYVVSGGSFVSKGENDEVRITDEVRRLWKLADAGDANAIHHLDTIGGAR